MQAELREKEIVRTPLCGKQLPDVRVMVLIVAPDRTPYNETVDVYQVELISACISCRGWVPVVAEYHPQTIERVLRTHVPDLVLNLAYGFTDPATGFVEYQPEVAARLEALGANLIGAASGAQILAQDKLQTAERVAARGVQSPRRFDPAHWPPDVNWAVHKPRYGAFHRGISLLRRGDPMPALASKDYLLEEYIDGDEYTISILSDARAGQLLCLQPARLVFVHRSEQPAIIKWEDGGWHFELSDTRMPVLEAAAVASFEALGLRDYARLDFRLRDNTPYLLDANALPGLHPVTGILPLSALGSGLGYHKLIWRLIEAGLSRAAAGVA